MNRAAQVPPSTTNSPGRLMYRARSVAENASAVASVATAPTMPTRAGGIMKSSLARGSGAVEPHSRKPAAGPIGGEGDENGRFAAHENGTEEDGRGVGE